MCECVSCISAMCVCVCHGVCQCVCVCVTIVTDGVTVCAGAARLVRAAFFFLGVGRTAAESASTAAGSAAIGRTFTET